MRAQYLFQGSALSTQLSYSQPPIDSIPTMPQTMDQGFSVQVFGRPSKAPTIATSLLNSPINRWEFEQTQFKGLLEPELLVQPPGDETEGKTVLKVLQRIFVAWHPICLGVLGGGGTQHVTG